MHKKNLFSINTNIKLGRNRRYKGTAILETTVGLFVLVPVLFLLLDVIALVIGQTINDDLAKNAARAAAQCTTSGSGQSAAQDFINGTIYAGHTGLVRNAGIAANGFNWDSTTNFRVSVGTKVTIVLPVPVPLGGPSSQDMYASASEPLLAVPPTATPAGSSS